MGCFRPDLIDVANEYLAAAPCNVGSCDKLGGKCLCDLNKAYDVGFRRIHDAQVGTKSSVGANSKLNRFSRKIKSEEDPEYVSHPKAFPQDDVLYAYNVEMLKHDRKMRDKWLNYHSEKYPWIESVQGCVCVCV